MPRRPRAPPRGAEPGQEVPIDAVVARDLPSEDQADGQAEQDRVRGCGASQQEGHVHEGPEERGDPGLMKERIRVELRKFLKKRTGRRPLVLPVVMEI